MKHLKRIIACTLILSIFFIPLKKENYAYAADMSIPMTIDSLDGSEISGTPLGALYAILLSIISVGSTTVAAIDDWNDPTSGFKDFVYEKANAGNDILQDWIDRAESQLVWAQDTTMNLADWLTKNPSGDFNIWEFFFPSETIIESNADVLEYFEEFLAEYVGVENLAPGSYSSTEFIINKVFENYHGNNFISLPTDNWKEYEYLLLGSYSTIINGVNIYNIPNLICMNNLPYGFYFQKSTTGTSYDGKCRFLIDGPILSVTNELIYEYDDIGKDLTFGSGSKFNFDDVYYCNIDLEFENIFRPADITDVTIDVSDYVLEYPLNDGITLDLNTDFVEKAKEIDLNTLVNTDAVAKVIPESVIVNNGINDKSDINTGFPPLDAILNGLKGVFEWLFVPSSLTLENAIEHCQATMDKNAGLLTYPLTLVIEFLLAVADLDTSQECIINIPEIEFKGFILFGGMEFNITKFIKDNGFSTVQTIIYSIGNFIMILGLLNMAKRKGDEIIRGI